MAALRSAAVLDRDGTLNPRPTPGRYITHPIGLHLLHGVTDAVKHLRRSGYVCVVVSNQHGVALGHLTQDDLAAVVDITSSVTDGTRGAAGEAKP